MGSLRLVPILLLLASAAFAQTYGVGRAPTAEELAQDITISPTGAELPPGHGTAKEGAGSLSRRAASAAMAPKAQEG